MMTTKTSGIVHGLGATMGLLEFTGYAVTEIMSSLFGSEPNAEISRKDLEAKIREARWKMRIDDRNFYNFAFVGHAKTGKSSLINSIRGLNNRDEGAAPTDTTECTQVIRYYTFRPAFNMKHVRFYDLPGSGTSTHPANSYFEDKCLYAFDCLIIMIQETLAEDEIEMAKQAMKYDLPVCFVRSKCDSDLFNKYQNGEIDAITKNEIEIHINTLFNFFHFQMHKAELPENMKIFFLSAPSLRKTMLSQKRENYQEIEFLHFLLLEALKSRQAGGDLSIWKRFKNVDKHRIVKISNSPPSQVPRFDEIESPEEQEFHEIPLRSQEEPIPRPTKTQPRQRSTQSLCLSSSRMKTSSRNDHFLSSPPR